MIHYLLLLLLSPLRWFVNFIVRFLWKPISFDKSLFKQKSKKPLTEFYNETLQTLYKNIGEIKKAGDSAKFVGLLLSSNPNDEKVLELFKEYITEDGLFIRKPAYKDTTFNKKGNFSGDMWAGYFAGLVALYEIGYFEKDKEFKERLLKAIDKSLFENPKFQFKSNYTIPDRGYLLRWFFGNAGHFLQILSMLEIAYKLSGKLKYKLLYLAIFPIAMIDILINPTFSIRIGKYRYVSWYFVHSCFTQYYYLYKLTKNPIYKYAYKFIYKRFPFNPEFAALNGDKDTALLFLADYTHKQKSYPSKVEQEKVINIKNAFSPKKRKHMYYKEFKKVIPPRYIKNDYLWEKSFLNIQFYDTPLAGIDFVRVACSSNVQSQPKGEG